jgi:hypothetical protein
MFQLPKQEAEIIPSPGQEMAPNGEANVPSAAEPTEGTVGDDAIMLASTAGSCGEKFFSFSSLSHYSGSAAIGCVVSAAVQIYNYTVCSPDPELFSQCEMIDLLISRSRRTCLP